MNHDSLKILFESDDLIVVDKDRFLAVHGGEGLSEGNTLLYQVKQYLTGKNGAAPEFITPAHRIDLNTRGPVIFAKNRETSRKLKIMFTRGEIIKTYEALLEGALASQLFIEADIVKGNHRKALVKNMKVMTENFPDRLAWLSQKDPDSRTISATMLIPLKISGDTTHCRVETWSGRYHQIRAVCEAAGFPVCGDTRYNHDPRFFHRRRTNKNFTDGQLLICKKIEIPALGLEFTSGFEI